MPTGPVATSDRIVFLDTLRGIAVMAIFIVNIKAMVMPFAYYMNPSLWTSELDQWIAIVQKFLIDDKWRTIFTALYGAGLAMMWERLDARDLGRGILFKRSAWLVVFGAIHLFGLWGGDILLIYGATGLLAVLFVRVGTVKLCIVAVVLLIIGTAWESLFSAGPVFDAELRAELKPMFWEPTEEGIKAEIARQNGPLVDRLANRIAEGRDFLLFSFLLGGMLPVTLGLMLGGMVLYRTGLLRGEWPLTKTVPLAIVLLGAAWSLDLMQVAALKAADYDFDVYSLNHWKAALDGFLGGFGYCCLVSAIVGASARQSALAAVGRMAFSNYIACTLIGTTLAVGHGFDLYAQVSLSSLMLVVVTTLIAMLVWSSAWLNRFRFGPLEWVWRSLLYGRRQPMRRGSIMV